ncbi:Cytochrome c oxidase assembly protein COX18, mitochondrial [Halotydeus destructor]|nr:Cytochrome c oxidase assembly protein COX18, mitochondrial [Halotydeus destructor]
MCSVLLRSRVCALKFKTTLKFTSRKSQSVLNCGQLQQRHASTLGQSVQNYMDSWIQSPITYPGVEPVEAAIIHFHSLTGNHWATDIVICTALVSLTCLPAAIVREHIYARYQKTTLELVEFRRELLESLRTPVMTNQITEEEAQKYFFGHVRKEEMKLRRIRAQPLKSMVRIMCDLSLRITYMLALKNISIGFPQHLAAETYQQMLTESLGWIPCLTSPDPYMIIPLAAGSISLINTEYMRKQRLRFPYTPKDPIQYVSVVFCSTAVIITGILCYFPANMSLCWLAFGILNLGRNVLIRHPRVKKLLRIPEIIVPTK